MKVIARALCAAGIAVMAFGFIVTLVFRSWAADTTQYGDLSHLVYTATGPLSASFVFPNDGFACPTIAVRFVLSTVRDAGVELSVDGVVVPTSKIGKRVVVVKTGQTQYEYYGVVLEPGPNDVVITPLGANGLRGPSQHATIYGPGPPVSVKARFEQPLVADGRTPQDLLVTAVDRWGNAAQPGSSVHIAITQGDARFEDAQATPAPVAAAVPQATATPLQNGMANDAVTQNDPARVYDAPLDVGGGVSVPVVPGMQPGNIDIRITSGDVEDLQSFFIEPYLRKPFVNGLVSVGAGAVPVGVDGDGVQDGGAARRGRIAVYASGKVGKRSSLTVAYESQNRLSPLSSYGPYVEDPNERPYLTYGDTSLRTDDIHSNTRLYARLDSGHSSVMAGDFAANIDDPSGLGAFHELLGGEKAQYAAPSDRFGATVFTARNTTAYASLVMPASGLSSLAQPLRPDIVVGSDYLTLIALDRRTGAVVSQTPLIRNIDYTIDYATGVLRFVNVPLPFDDAFNPQTVLVQYAYEGPSTTSQTTGALARVDFGRTRAASLQLGYVNDDTGSGNFSLWSQTLQGSMQGGTWTISHAVSHGIVPGAISSTLGTGSGGDATSFNYNRRAGSDQTTFNYTNTSAGFGNPFGGLAVPGFTSYRAAWVHDDPQRSQITLEVDGQMNHGLGTDDSQRTATAAWHRRVGSATTITLGLTSHTQSNVPSVSASSAPLGSATVTQALVGVDVKATKRISLNVQRTSTISGNDATTTQPAQTTAQLTYDMDKRGRLFIRELFSDAPVASFAQASSDLTVGAMATRSTAIGIERAIGSGTTVSSEYLINRTGNNTDLYSALGVQQQLKLSKQLSGSFFVQSANAAGTGSGGFTVSGASLGYTNDQRLRGGLAFQTRGGFGGGSTLTAGLAGQISPNVSAVSTINQAWGPGTRAADDRVSIAYRPSDDDRFISLLGWTRQTGTSFVSAGAQTNVVSFEEFWRFAPAWELSGRYAYKLDGDGTYLAHTSLAGLRARTYIGRRFDLGAEFSALAVPGITAARSTDFAVESGYTLGNGTRAAVGYSFRGSIDPSLTGQNTRKGFYFTLTTLVDRIFGWGKSK